MPSIRERRITWGVLYIVAIAVTTVYNGGYGFLAASFFLMLGFWAGWTYRNDRDH